MLVRERNGKRATAPRAPRFSLCATILSELTVCCDHAGITTCCLVRVHPTRVLRRLLRGVRVGLREGQLRGLSARLQQAGLRHGMLQRGEGVVVRPRVLTHLRGMGEVVRLRGKSGDGTPDGRHTPPAFHGRPTGLQGERQHRRAWRAAAPCMMATCGGATFAARSSTAKLGDGQSRCRLAKFSSGLGVEGVEEGIERCRVSDLGRGGQRQRQRQHMHMHMPPLGV